jgi:hypothetical protein
MDAIIAHEALNEAEKFREISSVPITTSSNASIKIPLLQQAELWSRASVPGAGCWRPITHMKSIVDKEPLDEPWVF